MAKYIVLLLISIFVSCKQEQKVPQPSFKTVSVDTLLHDKISIRALTVADNTVWYSGSGGKYGFVTLNSKENYSNTIVNDTLPTEFRAIAHTTSSVFILNVGTPASLYKIDKKSKTIKQVYTETGEKVFYDSMEFYNDMDGIAMGDPTSDCLSVIITNDGGETWTKISCDVLPKTADGEAAFAASDTNVIVKEGNIWIVSGGKKSRVFHSTDKGKTWEVYNTPIEQGSAMAGIFSADFYDDTIGFAVGGNYEKQDKNLGNKILTTDGGKSWQLVGEGVGFGYASCVQFVPNSEGNELVTAGPSGVYYSYDRGNTWKKIHDDTLLHTLRFVDNTTIIAAGQNKIIRLQLE
ncbi:WD40/YVTN/BNR-like repeat-containing protein [Flavobacterium litorale]|uniref:Oxidoreductase n=1 Tax=Flavobacterium litorale TaxID=2856519 RepID=A0ABX8VAS8_9FLAO|nr:oxidoreductase [Flavobacterium litorale]QYJ67915.1 oxidoreductase [Flavobacterium litorale]